ncbi:MAG: MurT ligase domain-containing protein [Oscillospiraceae bacterium]|nr:MurT ligase domain-containing protein [Oscillospiraceae bacterium]
MKVFLAVLLGKSLYFIGKLLGKGSSFPGQLTLKIFPNILTKLELPNIVIAVTGSNGKTSTSELIAHVLKINGKSVGLNYEGSNQTEGVATLLLRLSSFRGKIKSDAVVMECDERYVANIFKNVHPTVLVITNLCRDQLSRNGHHEFVRERLNAALSVLAENSEPPPTLILNADDPYVMSLFDDKTIKSENTILFGLESEKEITGHIGVYDDGTFCPGCKAKMIYEYRIAGHYGCYSCTTCDIKHENPKYKLLASKHGGITSAYNYAATLATAEAVGIDSSTVIKALDGYKLKSGRCLNIKVGNRDGVLLISKHENSFGYNSSLAWMVQQNKKCTVVILVDTISRKYHTGEVSWLWDIDFDILNNKNVENIILVGSYIDDLSKRFEFTNVSQDKISYVYDLEKLKKHIVHKTTGDVYITTCFADKNKLLKSVR